MKNVSMVGVCVLVGAMASGCAGAQVQMVRSDLAGGQMQLTGRYMPAVAEARVQMAEYCGGRFVAVEQGDQLAFTCVQNRSIEQLDVAQARREMTAGELALAGRAVAR